MTDRPNNLRILLLLFAVALLIQLPLILNPGYYSHDELQWASWSVGRPWQEVPWARLRDWDTFQYRPLTFNVWMQLSRWFFQTPYLMHAACVTIGTLNVALLWIWLRQLDVAKRTASIAALVWVLNPYTVQTHGWVGTLADTLWVLCALLAIVAVNRIATRSWSVLWQRSAAFSIALALTFAALLAKEAAIVIPAVFLVAALRPARRQAQIAALIGSGAAVFLYLAARLQAILAGAAHSTAYSISAADPLTRWIEYLMFPAVLERSDPIALMLQTFGANEWGSIVLLALITVVVWRRNWQLGALWILAPLAALVPVLPLPLTAGHYAYGASIAACVVLALAAPGFSRFGKIILACWLTVVSFHGLEIASKLRQRGAIQHMLGAEINRLLLQNTQQTLRIRTVLGKQEPMLRTIFMVPNYLGVPWGKAVTPTTQDDPSANYQMRSDGRLEPVVEPQTAPMPAPSNHRIMVPD